MPSAYGTWAQWRERRAMMGWAVMGIDNRPAPINHAWRKEHDEQVDVPPTANFTNINEIARAVADRRAG